MASDKTTVLVVDDEPLILLSTADALEMAGFEVLDACDVDHALIRLDERPDIKAIFTDVNMPGELDGVDLARLAYERSPDMLIIVTSGRATPSREELPEGGFFIPKPYRSNQVTALISTLLG